ncbi:MAG: glycosyltransferase family 4 protein [Nitrospira sp.]|nr:glycosyltransferase family 4 protein [Nitrospira sp.]
MNRLSAGGEQRQFSLLVVHQSAELYGSDRSLIEFLTGLDGSEYSVIACLPEHGPLEGVLQDAGLEVHVLPLFKVARKRLSPMGLLSMPGDLRRALAGLEAAVGGRRIDLVYTNTLAVLAGALWARKRGLPHIWHVREIILRPALVASLFQWLAPRLSIKMVCNSIQTKAWLSNGDHAVAARTVTVWNGVEANPASISDGEKSAIRESLQLSPRPLVLMVGRVNAFKGQDLLVDAVERIHARIGCDFDVLMLGSAPPGQGKYMVALRVKVNTSAARHVFQIREFVEDPAPYYRAADVLIVPSREPESFGRVAIEGMAHGLPVIAANHGGLQEIVEDGVTGVLFTPNDAEELADAIVRMLGSEQTRQAFSVAARERQQAFFSLDAYRAGMLSVLRDVLAQ